ncbi:MAG: glycine cleavage system protein GcvH [Planctomycetota bacterium]
MATPADRKYSESHEWHKADGDVVTLGITEFAVEQLTDVTFVEMKPVGTSIEAGDVVGEVESVKTTSDIYCHVSGEVVEVNEALADEPAMLNEDPYEKAWLCRIKTTDVSKLDALADAAAYDSEHAV